MRYFDTLTDLSIKQQETNRRCKWPSNLQTANLHAEKQAVYAAQRKALREQLGVKDVSL